MTLEILNIPDWSLPLKISYLESIFEDNKFMKSFMISANLILDMAYQSGFPVGSGGNTNSAGTANMPSRTPWLPCSMPWTMENPPQLVRFGEPQPSENVEWSHWCIPRPKLCSYKRKASFDFNPRPAKMHITEEKVAAQLKNMHISNNHVGEQGGFGDGFEKTACALPTLVLSKEVQNLTSFHHGSLLPESLLPKVEKPTQALVLWKPPSGSITSQIISTLRNTNEEESGDNPNNNSDNIDLNAMTTTSTSAEFFTPGTEMELS